MFSVSRFPNNLFIFCLNNPNMALHINANISQSHSHAFGDQQLPDDILILKNLQRTTNHHYGLSENGTSR